MLIMTMLNMLIIMNHRCRLHDTDHFTVELLQERGRQLLVLGVIGVITIIITFIITIITFPIICPTITINWGYWGV